MTRFAFVWPPWDSFFAKTRVKGVCFMLRVGPLFVMRLPRMGE